MIDKYNSGPGMDWDEWFHLMCESVAKKSQCLSRQIGAVLVMDKAIVSTGYNGPPRGVPHCGHRHKLDSELMAEYVEKGVSEEDIVTKTATTCPRYILGYKSGEGLDLCVAGHAERNALIILQEQESKQRSANYIWTVVFHVLHVYLCVSR